MQPHTDFSHRKASRDRDSGPGVQSNSNRSSGFSGASITIFTDKLFLASCSSSDCESCSSESTQRTISSGSRSSLSRTDRSAAPCWWQAATAPIRAILGVYQTVRGGWGRFKSVLQMTGCHRPKEVPGGPTGARLGPNSKTKPMTDSMFKLLHKRSINYHVYSIFLIRTDCRWSQSIIQLIM